MAAHRSDRIVQAGGGSFNLRSDGYPISRSRTGNRSSQNGVTTMKKIVLAAAAALAIAVSAAPSFASSSSLVEQSANIAAGGAAYPTGVLPHTK